MLGSLAVISVDLARPTILDTASWAIRIRDIPAVKATTTVIHALPLEDVVRRTVLNYVFAWRRSFVLAVVFPQVEFI